MSVPYYPQPIPNPRPNRPKPEKKKPKPHDTALCQACKLKFCPQKYVAWKEDQSYAEDASFLGESHDNDYDDEDYESGITDFINKSIHDLMRD